MPHIDSQATGWKKLEIGKNWRFSKFTLQNGHLRPAQWKSYPGEFFSFKFINKKNHLGRISFAPDLNAIQVLSEKKFRGVTKGEGDDDEFNRRIHLDVEEEDWKSAVEELPNEIVLHVPLPNEVVSETELDEFTKQIQLAFPKAKVKTNRDLKEDSNQPDIRLLWALELASQMQLRFRIKDKAEDEDYGSGKLGLGIDNFHRHGTPLNDVPKKIEGAFLYASELLALRPWSIFAPFEILKVTIKYNNEETVRWVMFMGGGDQHDGSDKKNSPFGSIQIQEDLSDLTSHFGRSEMYMRSGLMGARLYPDRLYISADPIGHVHYDTVFLLKRLFGNSISPEYVLDMGITPNMEVQTGRPDAYLAEDVMGRSFGRRPLNSDELDIVPKLCYYCLKFATECKLIGMKPTMGKFERTYPSLFGRAYLNDSVTIEYNMDRLHGGIWDSGQKYSKYQLFVCVFVCV